MSLTEGAQTVESFKNSLYHMQGVRKELTRELLNNGSINKNNFDVLKNTLNEMCDERTTQERRTIASRGLTFSINIQDELHGLKKDNEFLSRYMSVASDTNPYACMKDVDLPEILSKFFPAGVEEFYKEVETCKSFLTRLIAKESSTYVKPLFITDWDGTMKDYCSQYATNVQPVYSALVMGYFAKKYTRTFAVLTAGPLRRPGILDLTALPTDGPILFSGSWGREWWLKGRRIVHDDGIPEEGTVAIEQLYEELGDVLKLNDFVQFALVGSGIQKKVDRLTLGVQTVFGHIPEDLSSRYVNAVKERIHRVDPSNQYLVLEDCSPLEIEICVHSSGSVWNKGDGVCSLVESLGDDLRNGKVCVAGDTASDLPMLKRAAEENPEGVYALFVGVKEKLKESINQVVPDESRVCFVTSPDVIHAAFAMIMAESALD